MKEIYFDFISDFSFVLSFVSENFGKNDILIRKNQDLIKDRNLSIKNSRIKGYIFHGFGCEFILKNNNVDIEFDNDEVGFTDWSFYSYSKKINSQIKEDEVREYLNEMVNNERLKFNGKIFQLR